MVRFVFGTAIDCEPVRLRRRRWMPFQPAGVVMAPCGHLHFPPGSPHWSDDFTQADSALQGLFIHEMTHVWQAQVHGRWYLPLRRPFSRRYAYSLHPGWPLERYGIEQQAEIVRHAYLLRTGHSLAGVADERAYDLLVNFPGAQAMGMREG